jgi:hypothetical protein
MKFDLAAPCGNCPFRADVTFHLRTERVEEICDAITRGQQTFACHKTTEAGGAISGKEQHCACALILLEKADQPNQMMRIAERLGMYDRTKLRMDAPVFDDAEQMIEHFAELNGD